MGTDKPRISILMATYEPHLDWLKEQLTSLEAQTYPNLKLFLCDDCSQSVSMDEIKQCVKSCIHSFPVEITQNDENLGSNRTFEKLTREADGDFFAYCDQDDIWLPEKIGLTYELLQHNEQAGLVCSDVCIVDRVGKLLYPSIRKLRPRHVFLSGEHLYPELLYHNFVIGCTMLIRSPIAKTALPFADSMVHDHYLAFFCSLDHAILFCEKPLVQYRQHSGNQTGVLAHVTSRQQYTEKYINSFSNRIHELSLRFDLPELKEAKKWSDARLSNADGAISGAWSLWQMRKKDLRISLFELFVLHVPETIFGFVVNWIRQRR